MPLHCAVLPTKWWITLIAIYTLLQIFIVHIDAGTPPPCLIENSIKIEDPRMITKNGSLFDIMENIMYPYGYYFEDNEGNYRGCICKLKQCLRKCCARYEFYDSNFTCVTSETLTNTQLDDLFHPFIFDLPTLEPTNNNNNTVSTSAFQQFGIIYEKICIKNKYSLEPDKYPEEDQYFLLTNGSLFVPSMQRSLLVNEFCMEYMEHKASVTPLLCFAEEQQLSNAVFTVYPIGMLLSTVFMAITLIVYFLLPDLRNLRGILLMFHVASLLIAYLSLVIVQLASNKIPPWLCVLTAFVIEFTFAAAFFWLNIMCFDICWMFCGVTSHRSKPQSERRKLFLYSLYAWGCPLILLLVTCIMEFSPDIPDTAIKPNFGDLRCWFKDKLAILVYFFGPISLILLCNMVFFIITAIRIVNLRRGTAVLRHSDSQRSDSNENHQTFLLYFKLFVVMGLTWIMEIVSYSVGGSAYIWIITDICNSLQGLCIFLIFVWKPKVRRLLIARLRGKNRPPSLQTYENRRTIPLNRLTFVPSGGYSSDSTSNKLSSSTQITSLMAESMPDIAKCAVASDE